MKFISVIIVVVCVAISRVLGDCIVSQHVECSSDVSSASCACHGCCCPVPGYLVSGVKHSIPDAQMTSSSVYHSAGFEAPKARINNNAGMGVWLQKDGLTDQWIQFDLGDTWRIVGLVTKGRYSNDEWVTSYEVKYTSNIADYNSGKWKNAIYRTVPELGSSLIFPGNHDRSTAQVNWLSEPVTAQYVRIYPKTFNLYRSMRADIIGCFDN